LSHFFHPFPAKHAKRNPKDPKDHPLCDHAGENPDKRKRNPHPNSIPDKHSHQNKKTIHFAITHKAIIPPLSDFSDRIRQKEKSHRLRDPYIRIEDFGQYHPKREKASTSRSV